MKVLLSGRKVWRLVTKIFTEPSSRLSIMKALDCQIVFFLNIRVSQLVYAGYIVNLINLVTDLFIQVTLLV